MRSSSLSGVSGISGTVLRASILAGVVAVSALACGGNGFGGPWTGPRLIVTLKDQANVTGSPAQPLPLKINEPQPFVVSVHAVDVNGNPDTSYNGYVRMSSKPGAIERITDDGGDGRSLKLTNGDSPDVTIQITNPYGITVVLADDLGYEPADPAANPPPACSNGKDDDGDGKIDFPADEGCAFANDNSETGGSYTQGASAAIYYQLPRIADSRGLICDSSNRCSGSGKTPYPKEAVLLNTGYNELTNKFDFDTVVTRISSSGFYAQDTKDTRGGFTGLFAFNFSSPPNMRVCDRLKSFAGTASEFFGFTQLAYPTWELEEWDPQVRPCLVPEPVVIGPLDTDPTQLMPLTASLVRVETTADGKLSVMVTPHFGPDDVPCSTGAPATCTAAGAPPAGPIGIFKPGANATNCDLNKDGKIDFTAGVAEQLCSDACTADPGCTEYSNFVARSTFRLTISDGNNSAAIQADATAATDFDPVLSRGQKIRSFTGALTFFSGGSQFTIEARCTDDVIADVTASPLPSDKACVFPRTVIDDNPQ